MMLTIEEINANLDAGVYDYIGYIKKTNSSGFRTDVVKVFQVLVENGYTFADLEAYKNRKYYNSPTQLDIFQTSYFNGRNYK